MWLMPGRGRTRLAARRLTVGAVAGSSRRHCSARRARPAVGVYRLVCVALVILIWIWLTIGSKDAEATAEHALFRRQFLAREC